MKHTKKKVKYYEELTYTSFELLKEDFKTILWKEYGPVTVNNLGTKIYTKTGAFPPIYMDDSGYLLFTIGGCKTSENKQKTYNIRIHRLVAIAFIPNPDNLPEVNHKDGNKKNNCVSNLEWVTGLENSQHAWRTGLNHGMPGVKNGRHKLDEEEVKSIRKKFEDGLTRAEIARQYNVSWSLINFIVKNKSWKNI